MTTFDQTIEAANEHLLGDQRERLTTLTSGIGTSDTSVIFNYQAVIAAGGVISIGMEDMYVIQYDSGSSTATVIRGYRGSSAASHSTGATVVLNPRFSKWQIWLAMAVEINSWPRASVYNPVASTLSVATNTSVVMVDNTISNLVGIISANYPRRVGSLVAPTVGDSVGTLYGEVPNLRILRSVEGFARPLLALPNVALVAYDLSVVAAVPIIIDRSQDTTVDYSGTNVINDVMTEVMALGAAARLIRPRETSRTSRQTLGVPRDATDVPAGHIRSAGLDMWQQRNEALARAINSLRATYPLRFT